LSFRWVVVSIRETQVLVASKEIFKVDVNQINRLIEARFGIIHDLHASIARATVPETSIPSCSAHHAAAAVPFLTISPTPPQKVTLVRLPEMLPVFPMYAHIAAVRHVIHLHSAPISCSSVSAFLAPGILHKPYRLFDFRAKGSATFWAFKEDAADMLADAGVFGSGRVY
jgi:hypothetical protein